MSKLYVVLGLKYPPKNFDVFANITLRSEGPIEIVQFICENKEKVEEIKKSYIDITSVYEIDAKLINIDES